MTDMGNPAPTPDARGLSPAAYAAAIRRLIADHRNATRAVAEAAELANVKAHFAKKDTPDGR